MNICKIISLSTINSYLSPQFKYMIFHIFIYINQRVLILCCVSLLTPEAQKKIISQSASFSDEIFFHMQINQCSG